MDEPERAAVSTAASVHDTRRPRSSSLVRQPPMLNRPPGGNLNRRPSRRGDAIFRTLAQGSGVLLLVIMAAIAVFLVLQAIPALNADTTSFLTTLKWAPDGTPSSFGIAALAFGSVLTSVLALLISVPVAVGVALATSHYAPRWLARPLAYIVDLLAEIGRAHV